MTNISQLSQETLIKLVELAIESSPRAAAKILLENVFVDTEISKSMTSKQSDYFKQLYSARENEIDKILKSIDSGLRVEAIKLIRQYTGCGLKEARDTMMAVITNDYAGNSITVPLKDWVDMILSYRNTGKFEM